MRVCADHRIGVRKCILRENNLSQILEVHLVHNARPRRHGPEVTERVLRPAQQRVALEIAVVFQQDVLLECPGRTEFVHLDRVVDDQVHRDQRVRLLRISAHPRQRVPHRRQIHYAGHTGEILQQDPRRHELYFCLSPIGVPFRDVFDVAFPYHDAVLLPQQVLDQDLNGIGNTPQIEARSCQRAEAVHLVFAPIHAQSR